MYRVLDYNIVGLMEVELRDDLTYLLIARGNKAPRTSFHAESSI